MKTAPVIAALARRPDPVRHTLVHTGQHYDAAMSRVFLDELGVGEPNHMLDVGSGRARRRRPRASWSASSRSSSASVPTCCSSRAT